MVAFQKAEEVAAEKARVEKAAAVKAAGEKAAADVKVVVLSNIRPRLSLVVRVQYIVFPRNTLSGKCLCYSRLRKT